MTQTTSTTDTSTAAWEDEIRNLEEQARVAFLNGDIETLTLLWADAFTVNSPLDRIHSKDQVLDLLKAGRIRHSTYECEIEHVSRHGDVAIVMGHDRVTGPPAGVIARRRYTNVWQLQNGSWRSIARHAHVISAEAAG